MMSFGEVLGAAAAALYGRHSAAADLGRDLDVAESTVRRWLAGTHQPQNPDGVLADLKLIVEDRLDELSAVLENISSIGGEP
jgi:hypothetical protein